MATAREENVYLAKLAEQAERYEEMVEFMEKVTAASSEGDELTVEERNLLSVAYKNVIGARRASWRIVSSIEQKEEGRGNDDHVATIREYRSKIEAELSSICGGILRLLDTHLVPAATASDSKVFYLKMKGDYHRYLAEFKVAAERKDAAEATLAAYKAAQDIAVAELAPTHPIRLGLALNFSVFYYEILNSPDRACTLAKQPRRPASTAMGARSEKKQLKHQHPDAALKPCPASFKKKSALAEPRPADPVEDADPDFPCGGASLLSRQEAAEAYVCKRFWS